MLVLTRKQGETIVVTTSEGAVIISVEEVKGHRVVLGLEAPGSIKIMRGELQDKIDGQKAGA